MVAEARAQWEARTDARFVAWRGDEPLGSGGLSRAGDVLRLWGGATMPAARRQGVYAAVLRTRLATGWDWGTTLAIVRGRVETSAPLLREHRVHPRRARAVGRRPRAGLLTRDRPGARVAPCAPSRTPSPASPTS